MGTPVITVEGLSKYYRLGVVGGGTLREDVSRWWARKRGKPDPYSKVGHDTSKQPRRGQIWALRDIDLEVNEGEILGIVGRNGAGKSTLLKILSRITEPTSGRALIRGRVGSLLEVGTGFHPELTGRENVYLNGAILGLRHGEIARKLEDIVDFAEVAEFVDTPVKRYSSGMLVRLAFSVAAHLDPEILIVDEVLAVGDIAFQNKCLGKMRDVTQAESRTVMFVSHNMVSIERLCDRAVLVDNGRVSFSGSVRSVIDRYNSDTNSIDGTPLESRSDRAGTGQLRFLSCYFSGEGREKISTLSTGQNIAIHLPYEGSGVLTNVSVNVDLANHLGNVIVNFNCAASGGEIRTAPNSGEFTCTVPRFPLRQGRYYGNVSCLVNGVLSDQIQRAFVVDVIDGDYFGTGKLSPHGQFVTDHSWAVASV